MKDHNLKQILIELGLSSIESDIYIVLFQQSGLTGYKIASLISKPVANTYKALNHLVTKGLVVFSEADGSKAYSAIDFNEYTDRLENEFQHKKNTAMKRLRGLKVVSKNFGSFNLSEKAQVYEKAKSLIKSAAEILLIDIFPIPLKELKQVLEEKDKDDRVDCRIKIYSDEDLECRNKTVSYNGEEIVRDWIGNWLIICKDSQEVLIASFSKDSDELMHAIWSTDPFICFTIYNGMANEFMLIDILSHQHKYNSIDSKTIGQIGNRYENIFSFEVDTGNKIMKNVFHKEEGE